MDKLKYILVRVFFIGILLLSFNFIYLYYFFESDLQKYSPIINMVRAVDSSKVEILYVGESSNITYHKDDQDKRAISDFLADYFPFKKVGTITKEASHAGIYYELLRNIPEKSTVKTVVVTLNLRSFDANWIYSKLETPLQKSIVLLKDRPPLVNRFLLSFKGYDIKTDKEREAQYKNKWKNDILVFPFEFPYKTVKDWDKVLWRVGVTNKDGSRNQPLTELTCNYVKTYAFQIDTLSNPRIKDFDNIVVLAKERNWNLFFNLLAENIEMADSLVGKELTFLIKQNRDLVVKRYSRKGVIVVDNLDILPNEEFIDQDWTTEHYKEYGRKKIAYNLAMKLKTIY